MYVITPMLQRSAGESNIFPFSVSGASLNHTHTHTPAQDHTNMTEITLASFPSHKAYRLALISVFLAPSPTPVYTARARIRG